MNQVKDKDIQVQENKQSKQSKQSKQQAQNQTKTPKFGPPPQNKLIQQQRSLQTQTQNHNKGQQITGVDQAIKDRISNQNQALSEPKSLIEGQKMPQNKKQKVHQQNLTLKTLFTDEESPYASAPKKLKQLLKETQQNEQVRFEKINLEKLGFALRPTKNNFCSHFVKLDGKQQYVMCVLCKTEGCAAICYCTDCFRPESHIGHTITKETRIQGYAFCDCGRLERIKKQSTCPNHTNSQQIFQCQILQQERKQFVDCLTALLQCAVYCKFSKPLFKKIYQFLCSLNEGSIYYNRLTFQVLTQKSKFIQQQKLSDEYVDFDFFYFILLQGCKKKNKLIQQLMVHMCGDLHVRIQLIKFLCKVLDNGGLKTVQLCIHQNSLEELLIIAAIQKLTDEGFHHKILQAALESLQNIEAAQLVYGKYMKNRIKEIKTISQINEINFKAIPLNYKQLLLFRLLELFPSTQHIKQMIQAEQILKNPKFDIKTAKIRLKLLPKQIQLGMIIILQLLYLLCNRERQKVRNIRQYVISQGIKEQKIDQFVDWTIYGVSYELYYLNLQKMTNMNIVILLALMKNSQKQQLFIQKIWSILLQCHNPQVATASISKQLSMSQIQIYADIFHFTITLILRADLNILMDKNATKAKLSQEQQTYMQDWFRSFLYERKFLQRDDMLNIKGYGYLQFKGSTEILNQLCTYNEQFQRFQYSTPKIYKNISNKFPLIPSKNSYGTIYRNQVHFGEQANLGDNTLSKQLITKFLSAKNIVPLLDEQWQRYVRSAVKNDGKYYYGICYLFMLIYIDILTDGHNKQLRDRLQLIKDDVMLVGQFSNIDIEKNLICRMLMVDKIKISPEKVMKAEQKIVQSPEQKKIKAEQKKRKLKQKFEAHNKQILEKVQSQALQSKISQEEQVCILCHEKQKLNNQLVYICNINKNMTVGTAIFGQADLARTYISSCYHAMHVDCFISHKKEANFNFNCPLCQKVNNCILPLSIHKNTQRLNKVCENAKIASMVLMTNSYNVQSSFLLIFKHLVESKGLNSVVEKSRYKQSKKLWDKNDSYLQSLLIQIYENADNKNKIFFMRSLDKFVEEINACPKQQVKLIQLLFAQIYRKIATSQPVEVNLKLLQQIRAKVTEEDFNIVKQQIQGLTDDLIVLEPQSIQQQNKSKINLSMNLAILPKNSFECFNKYIGKCAICGKQSLNLCIICSHLSCNQCNTKHCNESHRGIIFSINFANFKITLLCKSTHTTENIYENQLKLPLQQALKIKGTNLNSFVLNQVKYEKLIKTFLEN